MSSRETPVSFVVCTHNGGQRLSLVIADLVERHRHQAAEIVVVDNASKDGAVARACDPLRSKELEVRVVREEKIGLAHARRAGVHAATGEIVVFVDDDNVLLGDWPKTLDEIFRMNPEIGACGGYGIGCLPDIPAPSWFERWCGIYAVGAQSGSPGDITDELGHLWGAGLAVRRSAVVELFRRGFCFRASGRSGSRMLSGEDWELCFALRLAGWQLWYDPSLVFLHLLDTVRFQPDYLRRLHAGFGAGSVVLDPYEWALGNTLRFPTRRHRGVAWQLAIALRVLASPQRVASRPPSAPVEFVIARFRGRFTQLLRMGLSYDRSFAEISTAPWRETS